MSEEIELEAVSDEENLLPEVEDFDQNGLLLKIATNGLSIPDYVKKLKEADILVAIDGKLYENGPANLRDIFLSKQREEAKWLLTLWRDGQIFDILITMPLESRFGLATEEETGWAKEEFQKHIYGDFQSYQNFEIYKDSHDICDILSLEKDPMAAFCPPLWLLKYRLFPPLGVVLVSYGITFFINIYLFIITYLVLSRFVHLNQENLLRSFTLFAGKKHYMTIAGTNEKDVSVIVKNIDRKNKIRFERNAIKKKAVVRKVIIKGKRINRNEFNISGLKFYCVLGQLIGLLVNCMSISFPIILRYIFLIR
jgi:uncharacterized membrane protein YqaE (UPF0057 family)